MSTEVDDLFVFTDELVEEFDKAVVTEPGKREFTEVPHGDYLVKVERTEVKLTPKKDKQLSMMLRVVEGEHKNRVIWKNGNLNKQGLPFVKNDLALLGFKAVKLSDLKSVVEELNDPANPRLVRVAKVANKKDPRYSNIYFNAIADESELEDLEPLAPGETPEF